MNGAELAESGWLPDTLVRAGIRRMLRERLREVMPADPEQRAAAKEAFLTSTTSFVMPVVAIDDTPVGDGKPGDVSLQLFDAYRRYLDQATDGI